MWTPDLEPIATALTDYYNLFNPTLALVRGGQNTINLRATTPDGDRLFVKIYPAETDLEAEREAIALSERAGTHGVPVARLLRDRDGYLLHTAGPVAFSVWGWVDGHLVTHPGHYHCLQAGRELGRIHAAFAHLPVARADREACLSEWRTVDAAGLATTIDRLFDAIRERSEPDEFDEAAAATLAERRTMLTHLPTLGAQVEQEVTVQVLHGDYSPVNLLYTTKEELAAVLDFCPPRPGLVAYDLGRMAFYPAE